MDCDDGLRQRSRLRGGGPRAPNRQPVVSSSTVSTWSASSPNTAAGDALYSVTAVAPSFVDVSYQRMGRGAAGVLPDPEGVSVGAGYSACHGRARFPSPIHAVKITLGCPPVAGPRQYRHGQ